jgi:O-antigen ligase
MAQQFADNIRNRLLTIACWSVCLCLFSIPINKPATNIFIFLALVGSLTGARMLERWKAALRHPVAIGALAWVAARGIAALYAPDGDERSSALNASIPLIYPLIVASLLETQQWRNRAMAAFGLSVSLILAASWLQFVGILPEREIASTFPSYRYTVFKDYTQQGMEFLVLAAMSASFALSEAGRRRKILLWVLTAAAGINVVFLLQSRTSYLIVVPLLVFWAWRLLGGRNASWRQLALGALMLGLCGFAAVMTPRVQQRLQQAKEDVSNYSNKREATSMGIRLELWKQTAPIIASAPIFGHGLGQWRPTFQAQVKNFPNYDEFRMGHPHQESLLILSEQGVVGLAVFIVLLIMLGRYIGRLPSPQREFYGSLLLIFITASLANCLWSDFSHRHVFIMLLACIPFATKRDDKLAAQSA